LVRALLNIFCGSDCTANTVFTHLLLHVLPLEVVVGAIAFENNVDFFFLFLVIVPPNITALCTGLKKKLVSSEKGWSPSCKNSGFRSMMGRYFRLARHWALFCPASVACPYVFSDVLEMVVRSARLGPASHSSLLFQDPLY